MKLFVSLPDEGIDRTRFIFVHPNEKLKFNNEWEGIYTLIFSKGKLSICFDECFQSERNVFRMFDIIILHLVCRFLQLQSDSQAFLEIANDITSRIDMEQLANDVDLFMNDGDLRIKYFTMAFHFQHEYGVLENICSGYDQYPPHETHCFLPMLRMTDYDNRPLVFTNNAASNPVAFRIYDFKSYSTVVSPSPIFNDNSNYIIRNYHNGVCKLVPSFTYKEAYRAKLSREETNEHNNFKFLIELNNRYYEVLAIYSYGMVSKFLPCLDSGKPGRCLNGSEIRKIFKRMNEDKSTSSNLKTLIDHQIVDNMSSFQKEIKLEDWLNNVISSYVNSLKIYESIPEDPEISFQSMHHGEMVVYQDETGIQMYYKTEKCSLVYTQIYEFSLPAIQVCFDDQAQNESDTFKFTNFASFLRGIFSLSINQIQQPFINSNDLDIHSYLIYLETFETKSLLDLNVLDESAFTV